MPVVRDLTHAGVLMSFQLGANVLCRVKSSNRPINTHTHISVIFYMMAFHQLFLALFSGELKNLHALMHMFIVVGVSFL